MLGDRADVVTAARSEARRGKRVSTNYWHSNTVASAARAPRAFWPGSDACEDRGAVPDVELKLVVSWHALKLPAVVSLALQPKAVQVLGSH